MENTYYKSTVKKLNTFDSKYSSLGGGLGFWDSKLLGWKKVALTFQSRKNKGPKSHTKEFFS